jgi:hypothetical protein
VAKTLKPSDGFVTASRIASGAANRARDEAINQANADYRAKERAAHDKRERARRALDEALRAELSIAQGLRDGAISTAKGNHAAARKLRLEITQVYRTDGDEATAIAALSSLTN